VSWTRGGEPAGMMGVTAHADRVVLDYRARSGSDDWMPMQYTVRLTWTATPFGGTRPWFVCPGSGCGRRVAILYGGMVFACRHCHRLAYACQSEDASSRAIRRADKIRGRLGWEPGVANGVGAKPKWMRWRTFERLVAEHDEHGARSTLALLERPFFRHHY